MITIEKLHAGYSGREVLKGVSIKLEEGDLGVVIGPNGSGKSTTVKSIFGLTEITSGRVSFDEKDLAGKPTYHIARLGIGYVPQGRLVFDSLTVEENLNMGGYDLKRELLKERKEKVLKIFPMLGKFLGKQASFLSGGQQQQLSIGRALMREPKLILLDEPSLGLDPKTQKLIFATLKRINNEGITILMVEQNARQALKICSKAFVIENGKVAMKGGPELRKNKKMKELYLGG